MKNKYFLTSLAMTVAVPAVVIPVAAASTVEPTFKDVTEKSYAYEAINYLTNEGIVAGYGNGYFGLNDHITRGQVSALIARYLKLDTTAVFDNPYSDVSGNAFESAILAVSNGGYMGGKGNGKFDPNATLTRAEMAAVLTKVFDLNVKKDDQFHDMSEDHWANEAVQALYSNGITFGSGDYQYNPNASVTREQYAEFLYRGIHLDAEFEAEPIPPKLEYTLSAVEKAVLNLTNAERQRVGAPPLKIDEKLLYTAREKSNDMSVNNYLSHQSPTYGSPFEHMQANGVSYSVAAENIARGYFTAESVVEGWMNSPGHRNNLLNPVFTHLGVGFDANGNYWTQQFIRSSE